MGPEDRVYPRLVLDAVAARQNIEALAAWCADRGILHAPHAKTSLSPYLLGLQRSTDPWGVTVADAQQAGQMFALGFERVIVASPVVGARSTAMLCGLLEAEGREIACFVDSEAGIEQLARAGGGGRRAPSVLVEFGVAGGRSGVRQVGDAELLALRAATAGLDVCGVAGYEGVLGADRSPVTIAAVDGYIDGLFALSDRLVASGLFGSGRRPVVTAGGSVWFDRVAARWQPHRHTTDLVLRCGAYVAHDHGFYARSTPAASAVAQAPQFTGALTVHAEVISVPEPGLVVLGFGKRHAPYDLDLPTPIATVSGRPVRGYLERFDDQVSTLRTPDDSLQCGDVVVFALSHPCTAFDKWREYDVVDGCCSTVKSATTLF